MADRSCQSPPGVTGTPKNTPKSIPGGPLKPASTGKDNKPNNGSYKKGQQGRG